MVWILVWTEWWVSLMSMKLRFVYRHNKARFNKSNQSLSLSFCQEASFKWHNGVLSNWMWFTTCFMWYSWLSTVYPWWWLFRCRTSILCLSMSGRCLLFGPSQSSGRSWCLIHRCPSPLVLLVLCWSFPPLGLGSGYGVVGLEQQEL